MRKEIYFLLFVSLIIFAGNLSFANYNNNNQVGYCSETEYNRLLNGYNMSKSQYKINMSAAQNSSSLADIDKYVEKFEKVTNNQIQRMQAANPYTRMGQMTPIDLDDYARAVNRQQQTNAMIRANNIAMGMPAGEVNFANEAQQLANARQAEEMARRTGLTPEQFIQGATLDYNTTGNALNNQQNFAGNLYIQGANYDITARNQYYNNANFYMQQLFQYQELMIQCINNMRRQ